ncbi:DUF336-domain-containing protein [Corynespora cassiicola Philippines]|uniref:DUF336-domain-containing protein n=1 Tax=Corynespora cassiicola Philippines TaxID=1448308 RepID=A0A2T2NT05_CORCC|nr:DUF336-domain-containing protein [Corynespora cassiicola Philippines]
MASSAAATVSQPTLTTLGARIALAAAEQHAIRIGVPMNIAIVDSYTHILSFLRMDGARITSVNAAFDKAFTAAGHRVPTSELKEDVWSGGGAFGIGARICAIGGGIPIIDEDGYILGAIGCATGTSEQDEEVAIKGRDAVLEYVKMDREREVVRDYIEREIRVKRARLEDTPPSDMAEMVQAEIAV